MPGKEDEDVLEEKDLERTQKDVSGEGLAAVALLGAGV
jgi:hypothetical protein